MSPCIIHAIYPLVLCPLLLLAAGCGSSSAPTANIKGSAKSSSSEEHGALSQPVQVQASKAAVPRADLHPQVLLKTSHGDIRLRLNAEKAPLTVHNFLENYLNRDFYAGTIFHYVDKGSMICGGGYTPQLEPKEVRAAIRNESYSGLSNKRGTIAMARHAEYPDSATSQFFINLADNAHLDFQDGEEPVEGYCVFGEVIAGMDVLERIAASQVQDREDFPNVPVDPIVIQAAQRVE